MRLAATIAAILLVFAASGGEVPAPDLPGTGCSTCLGKAWMPCPHEWKPKLDTAPSLKDLDVGPLKVGSFFCSACMALPCCQGLGWVSCAACAGPEAEAKRKGQLRDRSNWLVLPRREVDRRLGMAPIHIRTDHFDLTYSLNFKMMEVDVDVRTGAYRDGFLDEERLRLGIKKCRLKGVSPHLQAHIYARRLEECWEQFAKTFDPDGKHPLWPPLSQGHDVSYTPLKGEPRKSENMVRTWIPAGEPIREWIFLLSGGSLNGLTPGGQAQKTLCGVAGSLFCDILGRGGSANFQPDGAYHHYVYHNVAELLVHDYVISGADYAAAKSRRKGDWRSPSLDLPDWIHEGWARVQEMDRFGDASVQCHAEVQNEDFRPGKRKDYIKHLKEEMGKGKLLSLGDIGRLHRDKFNALIHMEIWYVLDALRRRDPAKFPVFIARIKCISAQLSDDKEGFARALEEVYGLTPLGLDEAWKAALLKEKIGGG